jgi:phage terminase small subunit
MRGVPTPTDVEAEFRAHYLYSGNAAASARAVGIPTKTGQDIAQRLLDDPAFAEDRRRLRARALDELVALRMRVANKAAARMLGTLPMPKHVSDGANVTIVDKRADYGRLVLDAEKNAQHLAKLDEGEKAVTGGGVTIIVRPTAEAQAALDDEDDGSPSGES